MVWQEFLAFLLASIVSIFFGLGKIPINTIFEAILAILIVLLVVFNKSFDIVTRWVHLAKLFLSALLVQLIIISTGAFQSPFLILLHLYTLGSSFLLKVSSALIFLVFSLIVLISATFLNPILLDLFKEDPGSTFLYFVSFIVIIPLAQFLMSTYHLKDTISKILTENLAIGEKREQSILSGLNELVLVTDKDLKILSFNGAVEKSLDLSGTIIGENLLSALHLKDKRSNPVTSESLSIDQVLQNRVTYFLKGFELETKYDKHFKILIKVDPITNMAGEVNQISFVITDAKVTELSSHASLDLAKQKQTTILDNLENALDKAHLSSVETQVFFLEKLEEDLLTAQDLEDHPFKQNVSYQDLVELCQAAIVKKTPLAKALQIPLKFSLSKDEVQEAAYLSLKKSNVPPQVLSPSEFSAPVDTKWLKILLEKLLDISMLLVLGQPNGTVNLYLDKIADDTISASVISSPMQLRESEGSNLFEKYYGSLASTNLKFGSGLEGFIAKAVSSELKLPIKVSINDGSTNKNTLVMGISIPQDAH